MIMSQADNSVKNWQKLAMSNPKVDLHNINAHTKFGEIPLRFIQVIVLKVKYGCIAGRKLSKIDKICPLAIPKQISTI